MKSEYEHGQKQRLGVLLFKVVRSASCQGALSSHPVLHRRSFVTPRIAASTKERKNYETYESLPAYDLARYCLRVASDMDGTLSNRHLL
jgi:hypothetical protein